LKYKIFLLVCTIAIIAFYIFSFSAQGKSYDDVTVDQVRLKITGKDSVILIDVRTVPEFHGSLGHISGAISVPLSELESRLNELEEYRKTEIIVICRSGNRSARATRFLKENGFNVSNMKGGMLFWNKMLKSTESDLTGDLNETIFE
jgi:rhodanese-related sulfurtransferase